MLVKSVRPQPCARWCVRSVAAMLTMFVVVGASGCGGDAGQSASADNSGNAGASTTKAVPPLHVALPAVISDPTIYIADRQGYFDDEKVKVTYDDAAGSNVGNLLISGRADVATLGVTGPLVLVETSKGTKPVTILFGSSSGGYGGALVGGENVKTLDQFKHMSKCKIASLPQATAAYGWAQIYFKQVNPNCDLLVVPDPPSQAAALAAGRADAAVGSPLSFQQVVADGKAHFLVDTRDAALTEKYAGKTFIESVYFTTPKVLQEKKESLRRFIKAWLKARDFYLGHSDDEVVKVLTGAPAYKQTPPEALKGVVNTYRSYLEVGDRTKGYISPAYWNYTLSQIQKYFGIKGFSASDPALAYDKIVDTSLLEEVQGPPPDGN